MSTCSRLCFAFVLNESDFRRQYGTIVKENGRSAARKNEKACRTELSNRLLNRAYKKTGPATPVAGPTQSLGFRTWKCSKPQILQNTIKQLLHHVPGKGGPLSFVTGIRLPHHDVGSVHRPAPPPHTTTGPSSPRKPLRSRHHPPTGIPQEPRTNRRPFPPARHGSKADANLDALSQRTPRVRSHKPYYAHNAQGTPPPCENASETSTSNSPKPQRDFASGETDKPRKRKRYWHGRVAFLGRRMSCAEHVYVRHTKPDPHLR